MTRQIPMTTINDWIMAVDRAKTKIEKAQAMIHFDEIAKWFADGEDIEIVNGSAKTPVIGIDPEGMPIY